MAHAFTIVNVQILNSKPTDFTLSIHRPVHSSQWTKGRSFNMASHFTYNRKLPTILIPWLHSHNVLPNAQIAGSLGKRTRPGVHHPNGPQFNIAVLERNAQARVLPVHLIGLSSYSLNKKEWICSLFKEWILEKSEIRVNLEWTFVLFTHSEVTTGITQDSEWTLRSLQNEWIINTNVHSKFTLISLFSKIHSRPNIFTLFCLESRRNKTLWWWSTYRFDIITTKRTIFSGWVVILCTL